MPSDQWRGESGSCESPLFAKSAANRIRTGVAWLRTMRPGPLDDSGLLARKFYHKTTC